MKLDDIRISKAIIKNFSEKLLNCLESDVVIVGAGPAGLTAAYFLAKSGVKTVVLERKLSVGGGMWGGGIMFNEIVVQEAGKEVLDEFDVITTPVGDGYYCADSVHAASTLCSQATRAGARIFNLMSVEDVMLIDGRVTGLVINWSAVELAHLHVDPITIRTGYVVDATGHAAEIAHILQKKSGHKLLTPEGVIMGERPMDAERGERTIVENTKEFFPGVFCAGMCCNAIFGGPRMGPIFGGMLLSGRRVSQLILERLSSR